MSKNVNVGNAGLVREVDMFDKKKGVMEAVGKIKPRTNTDAGKPVVSKTANGLDAPESATDKKSGNQTGAESVVAKKKPKANDYGSDSGSDEVESEERRGSGGSGEESTFRFNEVVETEAAKKEALEHTEANKKLIENVRSVEDRLKSREQINLTMMSIEIANLPAAHRFTKNYPWLRGSYGTTYSWVAEYDEQDDGTQASWKNMRWSFNLERNEADRNDLVITVCSKNLIIGRYVLGKDEFSDIPDTKTGYFEVCGDIMSGIGQAGKIRILFLKGKAERPKGPMKPVLPSQITPANAPMSELKQAAVQQKRIYVKVLSAAVMDLKSVHFLDVNCPFIAVEVGDWVGISDTAHNAGMAARWNSLNWKFTVTADVGVHLMIHSKNVLIGRMHVSLEEISNIEPKQNGVIEVIKHITDGKDVTGKVKLNLLAESPPAVEAVEDGTGELLDGELKTLDADGNIIEGNTGLPVNSASVVTFQSGAATDLAPLKPFMRVPFQINVHEVTLLDTIKAQYWRSNALAVNVVCGSWGKATDELKQSGSFAHWIDLRWKIPVKGTNNLRITAWSHGKPIGSANVTVAELLEMPTDYEHNTEIFAKLTNSKGEIVGKVKLSCKYESLVSVVNDKIVAVSKGSASSVASPGNRSPGGDKKSVNFAPNVGVDKQRGVKLEGEDGDDEDDEFGYQDNYSKASQHREELVLPIVATIKSISVYDAVAVHTFKRNAPYIKFICDRKSATTEAIKNAGAVATWQALDWIMKIREDSHVVAVLMSADVMIGRVEFNPQDLLHIPLNDEGLTEIKTLFKKDNSTTAKLHMIADLRNLEDLPMPDPAAIAVGRAANAVAVQNNMRRGIPVSYGNTAGGLDGVSIASFSGTLPRMQAPNSPQQPGAGQYQQQYGQPMPMFTPPAFNNGAFNANASQSQRVPVYPSSASRAPLGGAQFNNTASSYSAGNMFNNTYPGSLEHLHDMTWGNSMLLQQQQAQTPAAANQQMIFDRNLMSADNARKLGLFFNIAVQEIDLIDLPAMHSFAQNCPFVAAACGKWTASTDPIQNAGETAFWTKLNWKSTCKSGGNLRLIVNSKKVVMGSINFSTEDLLNAVSDDKGLRRVSGKIMSETGVANGRIKVAYTLDVVTSKNPAGATSSPQQTSYNAGDLGSVGPGQSTRLGSPGGYGGAGPASTAGAGAYNPGASQRVPTIVQNSPQPQYPFEMGDDSYYDELVDPDPRRQVDFPFNVHILELSSLDLLKVHQFKRNQPVVKAFCDTFYSETKVAAEYADVTYFRELNWIFPVKERSVFKITVASREKDIGSVVVDLIALKNIPFDPTGTREMVLSIQDDRGRSAGKVRMVVKLSNAATNEYDYRNSLDDGPLGMDGVSVSGAGGAQNMSYLSAMKAGAGAGISTKGSGKGIGKQRGSNGPVSVTGGQSMAGSLPGVQYGKDFEYLLQSQVEATNELANVALLNCTLMGVAVIDLRSVHTFAPNSPSVNIACGKVIATTPAAENAGKMANWEDLSIKMPIDRSSTLRVLISSGDKVIGQCSVNRTKLLGGRKNQKGLFVLFGELDNAGKIAGKIKFVYSLEDPAGGN